MGRQQSFVKFKSKEELNIELTRYGKRDTSQDQAYVVGVVKVIKKVRPFEKDELALVVSGERYEQRNIVNLEEGLGIKNVDRIVFIDNVNYCDKAFSKGISLGDYLDEHFMSIKENEFNGLGIVNPFYVTEKNNG
ncbi:hypothetical protein ACQCT3_18125 [Sutcliffiella horikoshii]|uniref:hypothetical protein n=1 Tax=Sutcliffiella horikoshii TaxID=79883 RepID=UPI003CF39BE1